MNNDFYNSVEVVKAIEEICKNLQITEGELSNIIGIHQPSLSRIKKGKHAAPANLGRIAALANRPLKDFYKETPDHIKVEIARNLQSRNISINK